MLPYLLRHAFIVPTLPRLIMPWYWAQNKTLTSGWKCDSRNSEGKTGDTINRYEQTVPQRAVWLQVFVPTKRLYIHLTVWSEHSDSSVVKLCALDWLEQKPAARCVPFVESLPTTAKSIVL